LAHTLEKDVATRLRDIADVRLFLQPAVGFDTISRRGSFARHVSGVLSLAAAFTIGIALALLWRPATNSKNADNPAELTRLTADGGFTTEPSISPDGRLVAYASDRAGVGNLDVWMQQTTGGGAIRLTTDPSDDRQPSISPDGTRVVFRSGRNGGGVYVVPAFGGDSRLIAAGGRAPKFSADGRSVAFWTGGWLATRGVGNIRRSFIVDANGGAPRQLAQQLASSGDPVWSPDGSVLLVYGRQAISGPDTAPDGGSSRSMAVRPAAPTRLRRSSLQAWTSQILTYSRIPNHGRAKACCLPRRGVRRMFVRFGASASIPNRGS
jgi:dipeptidyl aminopeptidase/acylaminoacyl peptidase